MSSRRLELTPEIWAALTAKRSISRSQWKSRGGSSRTERAVENLDVVSDFVGAPGRSSRSAADLVAELAAGILAADGSEDRHD
jgi:hypothetical protein